MFVKKLSLYNIRSYERNDVEFSKGINILVGPNNSGKTTILRSLNVLQKNNLDMRHADIRKTKDFGRILIDLHNVPEKLKDQLIDTERPYNKEIVLPGDVLSISYTLSYNKQKAENFEKIITVNEWIKSIDHDGKWYLKLTAEADINHFPAFKQLPNNENEGGFIYPFFSRRKTNHYNNNAKEDVYVITDTLVSLPAKISKLGQSTHPKNKEFTKYCEELLGFTPGIVPVPYSSGHEQRIGIFTTTSEVIPMDNMGEGVANILGLLSILLTEDGKLFLIEELENDIHPKVLKKLLDLIIEKSNKNQFVISTHSNIVVKYLGSAINSKLFYIDQELKSVTINDQPIKIPFSTIKEIDRSPQNRIKILEDLGYDFFDFEIYSCYLILEESSAESLLKNFLIPNFTPSLSPKLRTIAASGADDLKARFHDFQRLFVFIHTAHIYENKAWVLADGDSAGLKNINELKKRYKSWDKSSFINLTKCNIEEYYPKRFEKDVKEIFDTKDKQKRILAKEKLIIKVLKWCNSDTDTAINEFRDSAGEIITILQQIQNKVNSKE